MKHRDFPPAFVTYGWCRTAYVTVWSLGQKGIDVHVGDVSPLAMSRFSRYCKSFTKLPDFFTEPEKYFEEVCKALKKNGAKVLLPCHEDIGVFTERQDELPSDILVALPDKQTYNLVEDKLDCIELARKHGCLVPETNNISSFSDLNCFKQWSSWPLVIKTRAGNGAKGVRIAHDFDELKEKFKELIETYNLSSDRWPVIQQYLPGQIISVNVIYYKGRCIAASSDRYFRFKDMGITGTATFREILNNPNLVSKAISFMDRLGWHGIAQLEFIPDKEGTPRLNEINARPWGSMAMSVHAGVDFPYLWYLSAIDKPVAERITPQKKVKCRWIIGDYIALLQLIRQRKFKDAFKVLCPQRLCYHDDFNIKDPIPLFFEGLDYFVKLIKYGGSLNPATEGQIR